MLGTTSCLAYPAKAGHPLAGGARVEGLGGPSTRGEGGGPWCVGETRRRAKKGGGGVCHAYSPPGRGQPLQSPQEAPCALETLQVLLVGGDLQGRRGEQSADPHPFAGNPESQAAPVTGQ